MVTCLLPVGECFSQQLVLSTLSVLSKESYPVECKEQTLTKLSIHACYIPKVPTREKN